MWPIKGHWLLRLEVSDLYAIVANKEAWMSFVSRIGEINFGRHAWDSGMLTLFGLTAQTVGHSSIHHK